METVGLALNVREAGHRQLRHQPGGRVDLMRCAALQRAPAFRFLFLAALRGRRVQQHALRRLFRVCEGGVKALLLLLRLLGFI